MIIEIWRKAHETNGKKNLNDIVIGRCKIEKFVQGRVDVWTGSEGLWKVMILRKGTAYEENS